MHIILGINNAEFWYGHDSTGKNCERAGTNLSSAAHLLQIRVGPQKPGKSFCTTEYLCDSCSSAAAFWYNSATARKRRPVALRTPHRCPRAAAKAGNPVNALRCADEDRLEAIVLHATLYKALCLYGVIFPAELIEERGDSLPCASLCQETRRDRHMDMSTSAMATDASHSSKSTHEPIQGQHGELCACLLMYVVPTLPRHPCTRRTLCQC